MNRRPCQIAIWVALTVAGSLYASASSYSSAVTGVVRDSKGIPQMGAMVELLAPDSTVVAEAYTNLRGGFVFEHVIPGTYQMKVTAASFLPTLRENLKISVRGKMVVNLTLNTLFEAIQWLPAEPRSPSEPSDDWKWTLRSSSNRPLLRFLEDGPLVVVTSPDTQAAPQLEARVAVSGASRQFGESATQGAFEVERTSGSDGHLILRADVAPDTSHDSLYMAGFEQPLGLGREIRSLVAVQQAPQIEGASGSQTFQSIVFRSAESANLGPNLSADLGNQISAIRGPAELVSNSPFATVAWHSGGANVSYRVATAVNVQTPDQMADSETLTPQYTEENGALHIQRGLHQELEVEGNGQTLRALVAVYRDRLDNPIVNGGGSPSAQDFAGGNLLYDPLSQVMQTAGPDYSAAGVRAEIDRRLGVNVANTWISLSYASGDALMLPTLTSTATVSDALYSIEARRSQAIDTAITGTLPHIGTRWRASYRWQPAGTVNSVDIYDNFTQDAFLSLLIRQPIRCSRLFPNGTEALVAVRNLLEEGYRPFVTPDGSTLYFAQADRSIQGGLSFSF